MQIAYYRVDCEVIFIIIIQSCLQTIQSTVFIKESIILKYEKRKLHSYNHICMSITIKYSAFCIVMNKAFTKNNSIQVITRFTKPNNLGITTCDVSKQEKDSYGLYTVKH